MLLAPSLQVSSLVDLHSGGDALPLADDGLFVPDWVLDVQGVQQAQVIPRHVFVMVCCYGMNSMLFCYGMLLWYKFYAVLQMAHDSVPS